MQTGGQFLHRPETHGAAVFDLENLFSPITRTPDPVPLEAFQSALLDQAVAQACCWSVTGPAT